MCTVSDRRDQSWLQFFLSSLRWPTTVRPPTLKTSGDVQSEYDQKANVEKKRRWRLNVNMSKIMFSLKWVSSEMHGFSACLKEHNNILLTWTFTKSAALACFKPSVSIARHGASTLIFVLMFALRGVFVVTEVCVMCSLKLSSFWVCHVIQPPFNVVMCKNWVKYQCLLSDLLGSSNDKHLSFPEHQSCHQDRIDVTGQKHSYLTT